MVKDNEPFRLDSEFQAKECRAAVDAVRATNSEQFLASKPAIIHPHEIVREYVEDGGVWFFRAQNLRPLLIDDANKVFVSHEDAALLRQNRLNFGDVLVTRTGANRGDCAYFDSQEQSVASSHTFIIRSERWNHAFLVAFFNCRFGRLQIDKGVYGAAQPEVAPYFLRRIWIPRLSEKFQSAIAAKFSKAAEARNEVRRLFQDAETLLLDALGLGNWQPLEPLSYARRASEAFASQRIDAEYFHPAKRAYLERLRAMPGQPLSAHYQAIRKMFDPTAAAPGELVRNFDLTDALQPVLDDTREPMPAREIGSTKKRFAAGDVVISRLRAYLREIALVRTSPDVPAVGSSEFIVLRPRDAKQPALSRATLLVFLRSLPVQTILKWSQDGSHHPRFGDEDLLPIPVPNAVCDLSTQIDAHFESILTARARACTLLDCAKRAVEIAIEQNEQVALAHLNQSGT